MRMLMLAALLLMTAPLALRAQEFRLGAPVSKFTLLDMNGHPLNYKAHKGVTVLMFFSTRCPISNAFNYRRNQLYDDFKGRVHFLVVDPNANEPLAEVKQYATDVGFDFPVYKDMNNVVADRFGVKTTVDTFVMDGSGVIRYRGYVEDSPNASRATKRPLRQAIESVLENRPVAVVETQAIGCAIRRVKP